jgi:hypothetical protein
MRTPHAFSLLEWKRCIFESPVQKVDFELGPELHRWLGPNLGNNEKPAEKFRDRPASRFYHSWHDPFWDIVPMAPKKKRSAKQMNWR